MDILGKREAFRRAGQRLIQFPAKSIGIHLELRLRASFFVWFNVFQQKSLIPGRAEALRVIFCSMWLARPDPI
jgi:hypothetical protein